MSRFSELVLDESLYYDNDKHSFSEDLSRIIEILLKHNYPIVLTQELPGHIIVRFSGKEEYGCAQPVWLTEDERLSVNWEDDND